jgi:hypothetical protein
MTGPQGCSKQAPQDMWHLKLFVVKPEQLEIMLIGVVKGQTFSLINVASSHLRIQVPLRAARDVRMFLLVPRLRTARV